MIPDLAHSLTAIGIPAQFSAARTTADVNTPNAYILYSFWIWRKREKFNDNPIHVVHSKYPLQHNTEIAETYRIFEYLRRFQHCATLFMFTLDPRSRERRSSAATRVSQHFVMTARSKVSKDCWEHLCPQKRRYSANT